MQARLDASPPDMRYHLESRADPWNLARFTRLCRRRIWDTVLKIKSQSLKLDSIHSGGEARAMGVKFRIVLVVPKFW